MKTISVIGMLFVCFISQAQAASQATAANNSSATYIVVGAIGVNGPVYAMDVDYSLCTGHFNGVWVGGNFTKAGGGSAWNLVFWENDATGITYWDVPATPTVTSPSDGSVFSSPADVTVTADFPASGCAIEKVEFYEGNTLLDSITTVPYSFDWNGVPAGTHTLRAVATAGDGRIGISDPVSFTVQ